MIRPLADMRRRVDGARHDSDVALFYDLLALGELLVKLCAVGLIASLKEDNERLRYGIEHTLVRADGVGEWSASIRGLATGKARSKVAETAGTELHELSSKLPADSDAWQARALALLTQAAVEMDALEMRREAKAYGWMFFDRFPALRNRTRGHGAPRVGPCRKACPLLEEALNLVIDNFCLLQRPWFLVNRHLSGEMRVVPLADAPEPDALAQASIGPMHQDGVYILFDAPRRVSLVECEPDLADFRIANGAFDEKTGRYESLSYVRDERRTSDGASYLIPPAKLPQSATQGLGALATVGQTAANLPPPPPEYVRRTDLEEELTAVLTNDRHPVVTLLGAGGIGKTSLALRVLHDLSDTHRYGAIIWFSARDVDLAESGPKAVAPHIRSVAEMAGEYARLVHPSEPGQTQPSNLALLAAALTEGLDGAPVMFAFDNFETANDPSEIYRWVDTYVRNPNGVLITTRQRTFKGDYPIEVPGMSRREFDLLVDTAGEVLGIRGMLTDARKRELFDEADGHPYVAKVLLGEMARTRRANIRRIVAGRDDILDALFERTFTALPSTAQRLFLTLCGSSTSTPRLVFEAVLLRPGNARVDVEAAIDLLSQSSLVEFSYDAGDYENYIRVPAAARIFGRKKLAVSAHKTQVHRDLHHLRRFEPGERAVGVEKLARQLNAYFERTVDSLRKPGESLDEFVPVYEYLARRRPAVWLSLAQLFEEFRPGWVGLDRAAESVRNYLEHQPTDSNAWEWLSELSADGGDYLAAISALVERAALPDANYADISFAGSKLNEYLANDLLEVDEQRDLVRRTIELMEARISEATATDCATIAWLLLNSGSGRRAKYYVDRGLTLEPLNRHCVRLRDIVGKSARPSSKSPARQPERWKGEARVASASEGSPEVAHIRAALEEFGSTTDRQSALQQGGIPFSTVGHVLRGSFPKLNPQALGYRNLQGLVSAALEDSLLCVARGTSGDALPRLAHREHLPPGLLLVAAEQAVPRSSFLSDPRLRARLKDYKQLPQDASSDAIRLHAVGALERVLDHQELHREALSAGVPLEVVAPAVRHAVPFLAPLALGFRNMQHFLIDALDGTPLAMAVREGELPPHPRVIRRDKPPPGTRILRPSARVSSESDEHSVELYRRLLSQGLPVLKIADPELLRDVVSCCVDRLDVPSPLADLIAVVSGGVGRPPEDVKLVLLALVSARVFIREPDQSPLAEQRLSLRPEMQTVDGILEQVRGVAEQKISRRLGECHPELLSELVGGP